MARKTKHRLSTATHAPFAWPNFMPAFCRNWSPRRFTTPRACIGRQALATLRAHRQRFARCSEGLALAGPQASASQRKAFWGPHWAASARYATRTPRRAPEHGPARPGSALLWLLPEGIRSGCCRYKTRPCHWALARSGTHYGSHPDPPPCHWARAGAQRHGPNS